MTLKVDASYAERRFEGRLLGPIPGEQGHNRGALREQLPDIIQPGAPEELHLRLQTDLQEEWHDQLQEEVREQELRQLQAEERGRQAAELREHLRGGLLQQGSTEPPLHIPEEHHRVQ